VKVPYYYRPWRPLRESRGIALLFFVNLGTLDGGGWLTPRCGLFTPREWPGTHRIGGWVGLGARLNRCGKSPPPTGIRSPDLPALSELLLPCTPSRRKCCNLPVVCCLFELRMLRHVLAKRNQNVTERKFILWLSGFFSRADTWWSWWAHFSTFESSINQTGRLKYVMWDVRLNACKLLRFSFRWLYHKVMQTRDGYWSMLDCELQYSNTEGLHWTIFCLNILTRDLTVALFSDYPEYGGRNLLRIV
jgi:hypothetical protein